MFPRMLFITKPCKAIYDFLINMKGQLDWAVIYLTPLFGQQDGCRLHPTNGDVIQSKPTGPDGEILPKFLCTFFDKLDVNAVVVGEAFPLFIWKTPFRTLLIGTGGGNLLPGGVNLGFWNVDT